tara:strand:- start:10565 stop:11860 length:1296 start_codon:yes stop_codon:yes gene_type:complete
MGKSSTALDAFDLLMLLGSNYFPLLVLAPKRVARDVWSNETAKWDHLQDYKVSPIIGTPKEREAAARKKADIYTINYENIPWLVEFFGRKWPFRFVIADESTRLKGFRLKHGGKRAAALSRVAKATGRWLNLTGTPLPNGPIDLWGQNWFLDYGHRLGRTFTDFKNRWFDEWEYQVTPRPGAEQEIMSLVSDITLSLRAKDWFSDLEDPVPMPVYLDMPPRARSIYEDMEQEMFANLDDELAIETHAPAQRNMKCCQIANGAVYTHDPDAGEPPTWQEIHDVKIKAVKDISDETNNTPLMIVYHFQHDRDRLLKAFPEARLFESEQDRQDWNAGKIQKMLVHPDSAGHGLDFQDGGYIAVFFSQTWNLESRQQVIERIGPVRQLQAGHPRPVLSYELLMRDTTDEIMYERVESKASVQDTMRAYRDRKMAA